MRAQKAAFLQMFKSIGRDGMLLCACLLPILCGILFKGGVPLLEEMLCGYFNKKVVLVPYYRLIDIGYSLLAPAMFCFVSAMVVLEERDEGLASYSAITPLGKKGYLLSRLGIPAVCATVLTGLLLLPFSVSRLQIGTIAGLAVSGGGFGLVYALLIIRFSENRLEGMAAAKLASLTMLPAFCPFFIRGGAEYFLWLFPAWWGGAAVARNQPLLGAAGVLCGLAWIWGLGKKRDKAGGSFSSL